LSLSQGTSANAILASTAGGFFITVCVRLRVFNIKNRAHVGDLFTKVYMQSFQRLRTCVTTRIGTCWRQGFLLTAVPPSEAVGRFADDMKGVCLAKTVV
jgi:hypothetical protein